MYSSSFFMPSTWRTLDTILTVRQCKADQSENSNEILVQLSHAYFLQDTFTIPWNFRETSHAEMQMSKCPQYWKEKNGEERQKKRGGEKAKRFGIFFGQMYWQEKASTCSQTSFKWRSFCLIVFFFFRADTGFRRVGPKEYKPRLLQFNDEVPVNVLNFCVWWILINIEQFHYYNKN